MKKLILAFLSKLFKKPLAIPFPEEKPDYTQTLENTNILSVLGYWLTKYRVPVEFWNYWKTEGVHIQLTSGVPYPAATYELDGKRYMNIRPEWLNAGVIAHEQAHNSYSLLSNTDKQFFSVAYTPLKTTDPLIKLLYSMKASNMANDIEGHAEVYRYLGGKMPEVLKQYYPKLF